MIWTSMYYIYQNNKESLTLLFKLWLYIASVSVGFCQGHILFDICSNDDCCRFGNVGFVHQRQES